MLGCVCGLEIRYLAKKFTWGFWTRTTAIYFTFKTFVLTNVRSKRSCEHRLHFESWSYHLWHNQVLHCPWEQGPLHGISAAVLLLALRREVRGEVPHGRGAILSQGATGIQRDDDDGRGCGRAVVVVAVFVVCTWS